MHCAIKNSRICRLCRLVVVFVALAIDPDYLRFVYRAPLASDGRGPVVFLVRLGPLHATCPLVPSRRCARKKYGGICPFCALDSDCSPQPVAPANKRPSQSATRACFATLRGRFHVCRPGPFGKAKPPWVKKFVVGLYCGVAHHDVAFVGHGVIVRLFDFDAPKYYLRSVPVGTEEEHRRR